MRYSREYPSFLSCDSLLGIDDAAHYLDDGMSFGTDARDDHIGGFFRLNGCATGKNIGGGVAVFGPGMNCNMRLSDNDRSADTARIELVKRITENGGTALVGSIEQDIPQSVDIVKKYPVAVV